MKPIILINKSIHLLISSLVAPFPVEFKNCPMDKNHCPIWNCKYHHYGYDLKSFDYWFDAMYSKECQNPNKKGDEKDGQISNN